MRACDYYTPLKHEETGLSIILPTHNRSEMCAKTVKRILETRINNTDLLLVFKNRLEQEKLKDELVKLKVDYEKYPVFFIIEKSNEGVARAMEYGFENSNRNLCLYINDDITIHDDKWLFKLYNYHIDRFGLGWGVTAINDSVVHGRFAAFGLIHKDFYFTEIKSVPYKMYFQDNEISEKAEDLRIFQICKECEIEHHHTAAENNYPVMRVDKVLFEQRMKKWREEL